MWNTNVISYSERFSKLLLPGDVELGAAGLEAASMRLLMGDEIEHTLR